MKGCQLFNPGQTSRRYSPLLELPMLHTEVTRTLISSKELG